MISGAEIIEDHDSESGLRFAFGGSYNIDVLKQLVAKTEAIHWTYGYREPKKASERRFIIASPKRSDEVSWSKHTQVMADREAFAFIYNDVRGRIYRQSAPSEPIGGHMKRAVLLHLAQSRHPQSAAVIADELNEGQRDSAAAVRQAIQRLNRDMPELVIRIPWRGYLLNPAMAWLVIWEVWA